jgi:hypothetical protein
MKDILGAAAVGLAFSNTIQVGHLQSDIHASSSCSSTLSVYGSMAYCQC